MYKCMRMRVYKRMCMCICTWHTREGGGRVDCLMQVLRQSLTIERWICGPIG